MGKWENGKGEYNELNSCCFFPLSFAIGVILLAIATC